MALKPCRECGHEVSTSAKICPHCGVKRPVAASLGCGSGLLLFLAGVLTIMVVWSMSEDGARGNGTVEVVEPIACLDVSPALVEAIESGLNVTGGGSIGRAAAVRSGAHQNAFYVAAEIRGAGIDGTIGVWATNNLDAQGMLYSVDGYANEFSDWGDGRTTDAAFSMSDPGAREARTCLR